VLDGGKDAGDHRYVAALEYEDGRIVEGRTAPTVDGALSGAGAQEERR
jgi:hypothetical protein